MAAVGGEARECVPKREEAGEDDDFGSFASISISIDVQAECRAAKKQARAAHAPLAFK